VARGSPATRTDTLAAVGFGASAWKPKPRFTGTCYKASNWHYLGDTQSRDKLDALHSNASSGGAG
jgi:hypothetical protein